MTITVTQECINKGERYTSCYCPIALAIKDKYPEVAVGLRSLTLDSSVPDVQWIDLPKEAIEFIEAFDYYKDVKPFTFELELP